jgi:uncharacterized protein
MDELDVIVLTLDEFEAIRLADLDGLYQDQAAAAMGVSRPTLSRIVESGRRKVADALVHGKAIRIEGGPVHLAARHCCRVHDGPGDNQVRRRRPRSGRCGWPGAGPA